MKKRVSTTYHFDRSGDLAGNAPDEAGPRRELSETANLVGIGEGADLVAADRRAITAVLQNAFSAEQYARFRAIIDGTIASRRARLNSIGARRRADGSIVVDGDEKPGEFVFEPTHAQRVFAADVLRQVDQVEARWRALDAEIVRLMANAEETLVTGLEPNHDEERRLDETEAVAS